MRYKGRREFFIKVSIDSHFLSQGTTNNYHLGDDARRSMTKATDNLGSIEFDDYWNPGTTCCDDGLCVCFWIKCPFINSSSILETTHPLITLRIAVE